MSLLLILLALGLAVLALSRAGHAERRATALEGRLRELEAALRGGQPQRPSPEAAQAAPLSPSAAPIWPEDRPAPQPGAAGPEGIPETAARPRGPSLWGPAYSRARISVVGGLLVLLGLAFTLRALGAPDWTLLLAVFGFAGLLYANARRVPWPVSGALRGLGYGVAALGLGSLSQRLPEPWGPGAVLGGLLLLSAALLWDSGRRREPLLGVLAVFGAAQSTWMLTDDLGRASIPAAGLVLALAAAALWARRQGQPALSESTPESREQERAGEAARPLTLLVAGAVPVGWAVASFSHVPWGAAEDAADAARWGLQVAAVPGALLPWVAFAGLALLVPAALLLAPRRDRVGAALRLGAAWATLSPLALTALAVGAALSGRPLPPVEVALGLGLSALLAVASRRAWLAGRARADLPDPEGLNPERGLAPTVAGALLSGAVGVAGAVALGALEGRTVGVALAGLAAALLSVGLYGRSRFWLRAGAAALLAVALWSSLSGLGAGIWADGRLPPTELLLALVPATLAVLAALRLAHDPWAVGARVRPSGPARPRLTAPLLGAAGSGLTALPLLPGPAGWLLGAVLLAAAALVALTRTPALNTRPVSRLTVGLSFAPLLALGSLGALTSGLPAAPEWMGVLAALASGAGLLLAFMGPRGVDGAQGREGALWPQAAQGLALALVAGGFIRAALTWWPALGAPGAMALTALLAATLPMTLGVWRVDVLTALGALLLWDGLAGHLVRLSRPELDGLGQAAPELPALPVVGAAALLAVWALTRGGALRGRFAPGLARDIQPVTPPWSSVWAALLLGLGALAVGLALVPQNPLPGLVASSLAVLLTGLHACWSASRAPDVVWARPWWTTGLLLIALAGLKGAAADAGAASNPPAALGVAGLVTGLSLLSVAILSPRPGREEGSVA